MRKYFGLMFAVWINWIFFGLFFILSGLVIWAIFNQKDINLILKLEAVGILLFVTLLPAIIFMVNAILLRKISKEDPPISQPETFNNLQ